jgi:hypothetical protein
MNKNHELIFDISNAYFPIINVMEHNILNKPINQFSYRIWTPSVCFLLSGWEASFHNRLTNR